MKKLLIYGDSISNGNHGDNAYLPLLEKNGYVITNRAVGSSGLCANTPSSMVEEVGKYEHRDYDIVLIWHGTNDWYWGSGLDEFSSTFRSLIKTIKERNPLALILSLGPIYRYEAPYKMKEKVEAFFSPNCVGLTLLDYSSLIKTLSYENGVYFVDMNSLVGINKYNANYFLEDNVHPNNKGYERIGRVVLSSLSTISFVMG